MVAGHQTIATGGGATITTGPNGVASSDSQKLAGTGPGSVSGTFAPSGTSGAQFWLAIGTVSVASASPNLLTGTSQSDSAITTVQCPAMTNAIGGGFSIDGQVNKYDGTRQVIPDPNVGDHAVGSYPVNAGGLPKLFGTNPSGWGTRGPSGRDDSRQQLRASLRDVLDLN